MFCLVFKSPNSVQSLNIYIISCTGFNTELFLFIQLQRVITGVCWLMETMKLLRVTRSAKIQSLNLSQLKMFMWVFDTFLMNPYSWSFKFFIWQRMRATTNDLYTGYMFFRARRHKLLTLTSVVETLKIVRALTVMVMMSMKDAQSSTTSQTTLST